ncbi:MAG TPA: cytochrome c oxidase subunit II [Alphaproteobacteria bacterium]|nr:cytochrome c oxidase subunit II [Alphaproteobacteria bacterium]
MTQTNSRSILTRCRNLAFTLAAFLFTTPVFAAVDTQGEQVGVPKNWQFGFQPPASPVKDQMHFFHNQLLFPIITVITIFVMLLLLYVMIRFNAKANPKPSKTTHNTMLEVVWTLVPVLILVVIVIPSMKLLYFADKTADAEMTLKVTGFQWYWGYSYPDHGDIEYNAYMVKDDELKEGQVRLLSTDEPVVLPIQTNIRILVTAQDVLHSWAMPALGVKMDAVPGHTNETWTRIEREGIYYGQCSELCGKDHGFMPIEIHAVSKEKFAEWVAFKGGTMPAVTAAADTAEAIAAEAMPAAEQEAVAEDEAPADETEAEATVETDAADAAATDATIDADAVDAATKTAE